MTARILAVELSRGSPAILYETVLVAAQNFSATSVLSVRSVVNDSARHSRPIALGER